MKLTNLHPRLRPNQASVEKALLPVMRRRGEGPVHFAFTDDATMAKIAGRYRNSPRPTDVLAFAYGDKDLAGEVVVSLDTARRQARARGVPLLSEVILLCLHGFLHIRGEDDETYVAWRRMRIAEFETLMRILK